MLITRVHANAVARLGIDASYVTDGASKRSRLVKGKNGDIWSLFFALLDFRTAEIGLGKVSSHIEDEGALAIELGFAHLCDIIGNALADETAELAANKLHPPQQDCSDSEELNKEAF